MKIVQVSSTGVCGIAVYTDRICTELRKKNHEVVRLSVKDEVNSVASNFSKDAILHLHYEPFFIDWNKAAALASCAKTSGMKTVVTMHYSNKEHSDRLSKYFNTILLHKNNGEDASNIKYIPMGCPVFEKPNKQELRKKYGLDNGFFVASTFGFLVSWKRFDEIMGGFVNLFDKYPSLILQMLTSFHKQMEGDSVSVYNSVRKIFDKAGVLDKVIWKTEFLPENEMLERLALSDMGFMYAPVDTGSISAAAKEFTAARLPVVLSNSNHFTDCQVGCIKVPKNVPDMVDGIQTMIEENTLRSRLEKEADELYNEINYSKVADKHLEIYNS